MTNIYAIIYTNSPILLFKLLNVTNKSKIQGSIINKILIIPISALN